MTSELKPINKSGYGSPISYDRQEAMRILSLCVCKSCSGTGERNDADCGDIFYSTWECTDCDGKGWDKQIYMESFPCTRAVPDVPALVRYGWNSEEQIVDPMADDEYVYHDQAVEVIAGERNKNEQLLKRAQTSESRHKDTTAAFERERKQSLQQQQEIKELDAKLAQINDQKPIGYVSGSFFESLKIDRFHSIAAYVMKDKTERYNHALYTAPVASDAETIDAHRYRYLRNQDVETIYKGGVFAGKTPDNIVLSGGDLDNAIDRALSGKEPS